MRRANLAAAMRSISQGGTAAASGSALLEAEAARPTPLPLHPPILPCGCDGTGWRIIAARTLAGGEVERMVRCLCWLQAHPRPAPKPTRKTKSTKPRPSTRPVNDPRSRQFRDDD